MHDLVKTQLAHAVACAKAPDDFHSALRRELGAFNGINESETKRLGVELACREGCSLCCASLRVDVYAPEVFLIADHVRRQFTLQELEDLMKRLRAHTETVLPLTTLQHVSRNIACPLLVNGRCSVYRSRPFSCRRHHSQDVAACQHTYDHPEDLEFPSAHDKELFDTLTAAMSKGAEVYKRLGYDNTIYELGTALTEALSNPASWRRWRDKKKAFMKASVTPAA